MSLQQDIDRKNNETAKARRDHFGRKSTDQQHHSNLLSHVNVLMDALRADISAGMSVSSNLRAAMKEMGLAVTLSKRKLQP